MYFKSTPDGDVKSYLLVFHHKIEPVKIIIDTLSCGEFFSQMKISFTAVNL